MGWLADKRGADFEQIQAQQILGYEETLVKRIMAVAGWSAARVRQEACDAGYEQPTMAWLRRCTRFPVYMGAAKLRWMQDVSVGSLFGPGFVQQPFFRAYTQFIDDAELDDRAQRCGLVFNWPGIAKGGSAMTLHNVPLDAVAAPELRLERGTRIVRPYGNPPVIYVIEALSDFLAMLGTGWCQL
jgi:hypothetical protein